MVGRFVQYQPVDVFEHQLAKTYFSSFATTENENFTGDVFVSQTATCESCTNFVVGEAGIFVPNIFQSSFFVLFTFFLFKVTRLQEFAQFNFAANRRNQTEDGFEESGFTQAVYATDCDFLTAFQIEGNRTGKGSVIAQNQVFSFNNETARSASFIKSKGRFNFFAGLFNHFHFVQLALTALRHIGGCNASFVTSNEVFQFSNFLLLAFVSSFLLRFVDCIHFLEAVVVASVTGKVAVFQMVDYVYYIVKEGNIMGDEDECVLIVLQEFGEPFNMFNVQIVGRFVQEQDVGVLEEQFS